MTDEKSFIGYKRQKTTRRRVRVADRLSRILITAGGIGTVVAVSAVLLFLLWVAIPLLRPAVLDADHFLPTPPAAARPSGTGLDEYGLLAWNGNADGSVQCVRLDNGQTLQTVRPFGEVVPTSVQFSADRTDAVWGFEDGHVVLGGPGFITRHADVPDAPEAFRSLAVGASATQGTAVWQRASESQFRIQELRVRADVTIPAEVVSPVVHADAVRSPRGLFYAVLHADGELFVGRMTERQNLLTGETTLTKTSAKIPWSRVGDHGLPDFFALSGLGDTLILAWADGRLQRYGFRSFAEPIRLDNLDALGAPELRITACGYLLGGTTLLVGDSSGRVRAWFPVHPETPGECAGDTYLTAAHTFPGEGSAVTALASSSLMRMAAIGTADGAVRLVHITSGKRLARVRSGSEASPSPVWALAFAPKDDGLLAVGARGATRWHLDPRHPEATAASLFRPVWYEGASHPAHTWQSSAASDDFEPKYGLMPLVFGTLKATVFSLLFGVPIALLAAIFTSEFLPARTRAVVKPLVELMASLPSVVLGFLAALVFAPVVGANLAAVLTAFATVPLSFLLGAYLWQLLPHRFALRIQRFRFPAMFLPMPLGLWLAYELGPVVERVCFAGNAIRWLDGQIGGAAGGWAVLLFPLTGVAAAAGVNGLARPGLRRMSRVLPRGVCAALDLVKFGLILFAAIAGAAGVGAGLQAMGFDPRGVLVGTYVQRNAMVVGFVMGFAVIPIIYTIAEDALSAVPEHLRSASLAAGATPWQTAMRIIVPTAMSGLFSAVMIGLGRAVGETMIVLMAAGNTPILQWNPFNGFRTLSANIAVELPEAVRNSTHYRTLFLAALVLFVITFVLNTVAEIVRMRFRKKAFEL